MASRRRATRGRGSGRRSRARSTSRLPAGACPAQEEPQIDGDERADPQPGEEGEQQHEPEEERSSNEQNGDGGHGDKLAKLIKIHSKINKSPNDHKLILLDLSCDALHLKNMNTHATVLCFYL